MRILVRYVLPALALLASFYALYLHGGWSNVLDGTTNQWPKSGPKLRGGMPDETKVQVECIGGPLDGVLLDADRRNVVNSGFYWLRGWYYFAFCHLSEGGPLVSGFFWTEEISTSNTDHHATT